MKANTNPKWIVTLFIFISSNFILMVEAEENAEALPEDLFHGVGSNQPILETVSLGGLLNGAGPSGLGNEDSGNYLFGFGGLLGNGGTLGLTNGLEYWAGQGNGLISSLLEGGESLIESGESVLAGLFDSSQDGGLGEQIQNYQQTVYDFIGSLVDGISLNGKMSNWSTSAKSPFSLALPSGIDKNQGEHNCAHVEEDSKILTNAIERTVNFYETHIDKINVLDSAVGLQVLEGVLEHILKNGEGNSQLNKLINRLPPLITQIVNQSESNENIPLFKKQIQEIGNDKNIWKRAFVHWKSPSKINNKKMEFQEVGNDKETFWGSLNGQCQAALISRCDIPYVCRRTFLDPEPQSQYMLTHQALYLILAKQKSCDQKHPEIFKSSESMLDLQCAKIYQEASLIAQNGFPLWARDLFAEQIAICGFAGYPNFLRRDWLQKILSWQSPTESGCFVDAISNKFVSLDKVFAIPQKLLTKTEKNSTAFVTHKKESCLPHLTSVSLTAMAVRLGYLFDTC